MIGLVIAVMAVVGVDAVVKYQPLIEEHLGEVVAHLSVTNFLYTVLAGLALGTLSEMNDGSKRAYY